MLVAGKTRPEEYEVHVVLLGQASRRKDFHGLSQDILPLPIAETTGIQDNECIIADTKLFADSRDTACRRVVFGLVYAVIECLKLSSITGITL